MNMIGKKYADLLMNIVLSSSTMIEALGPDFLETRRSGKKWNKRQILGHLIDSAYNNHQRIIRTEAQGNMIYKGYDADYWVDMNQYAVRKSDEVLESFIVVQRHFANVVAGLSDEKLTLEYEDHQLNETAMQEFPSGGRGSLSFLIWDYIYHIEHHLKQIFDDYISVCPDDFYQ